MKRRFDFPRVVLASLALVVASGWSLGVASSVSSRQAREDLLLVEVLSDTPVVSADQLPAGFHRILNTDLPLLQQPGRPELPYRTILVGLPEGRTIRLRARSLASDRLGAFRLAPFFPRAAFGMEAGFSEAAGPLLRASLEEAEDLWTDAPALYPGSLAVVESLGVLRDQRVAVLRVYPTQYSPADFDLVHHPRIELRIRFVEENGAAGLALEGGSTPARIDPEASGDLAHLEAFEVMMHRGLINAGMIAKDRQRRRALAPRIDGVVRSIESSGSPAGASFTGGPEAVKISVTQDGLHQVTPAMLTAAGADVSMVDPLSFRMRSGGLDIPILVDGEGDGSFDPNDRVIFYGTGIRYDRYTRTNIYYLSFNSTPGPRMAGRSGTFTGPAPAPQSFLTTVHAELNLNYTTRIRPGVTEAWYWGIQTRGDPGSESLDYPIVLDRVDPLAHTIAVRARSLGLTDGSHTPRLFVNNTQIAENSFVGQVNYTQSASAPSTLLAGGPNTIKVTLINNGNFNDRIATDYFEVDYRRTYQVDADRLMFDGEGTGTVHITLGNLGSSNLVLVDVTAPDTPEVITLPPSQVTGGPPFTASFEDVLLSDHAYAVSTRAALLAPAAVTMDVTSTLRTPSNGADYIIITDRSLLSAMQPLAAFRAGQGLRTMVVATDDIYDEFNFGRANPAAIRSFLAYAYTTWSQLPAPTFVLLAGDGHIDYTGNFGAAALASELVPPILRNIGGLEQPSDNDYVAVVGADVLPEMIVGRLPIQSAADAGTIITNIINYEMTPPVAALNHQSLFVADNNDPIFAAILNNLKDFMPPAMGAMDAYLPGGDPNSPPTTTQINATTDAIIAGLNDGSLLSTYLGHGNVTLWASEKVLEHNPNPPTGGSGARLDMNRLTSSGHQTFLVALNCINGYFTDLIPAGPGHVDYALAEEFLRRPNRGAIAAWAPSSLGQLSDYDGIAYELYGNLFSERMTTIGPAAVTALVDAVNIFGVSTSNISSMHLFGDPASRLALDSDNDGLLDYQEVALGTSPIDADTDDDGLSDGVEVTVHLTDPTVADSDLDGLSDGTELGVVAPGPGTDPNAAGFMPDADPGTTTDPLDQDTDDGGIQDGAEDANHNGRVDPGETDPNIGSDDLACPGPLTEVTNLLVTRSGDDVVLSWDPSSVTCATYRVYAATNTPIPKSSFAAFTLLGDTGAAGFIHLGGAIDGAQHDYLVRIVHPQLGPGPLGAYGQ